MIRKFDSSGAVVCWDSQRVLRQSAEHAFGAIGKAKCHHTWPFQVNSSKAAKLDVVLSSLALALACKKSNPSQRTNKNTKKLPVPGPKNPS